MFTLAYICLLFNTSRDILIPECIEDICLVKGLHAEMKTSDSSKRKLPLLLLAAAAAAAAADEDAGGGDLDAGGGGDFSLGMVNTAALGFNCRHQDW